MSSVEVSSGTSKVSPVPSSPSIPSIPSGSGATGGKRAICEIPPDASVCIACVDPVRIRGEPKPATYITVNSDGTVSTKVMRPQLKVGNRFNNAASETPPVITSPKTEVPPVSMVPSVAEIPESSSAPPVSMAISSSSVVDLMSFTSNTFIPSIPSAVSQPSPITPPPMLVSGSSETLIGVSPLMPGEVTTPAIITESSVPVVSLIDPVVPPLNPVVPPSNPVVSLIDPIMPPSNSTRWSLVPNGNYVPYFNHELFVTRNCETSLQDNSLKMTVELAGLLSNEPKIYPFGSTKAIQSDLLAPINLFFKCDDTDMDGMEGMEGMEGTVNAKWVLENGIYYLTLDTYLTRQNQPISFVDISLPVVFTYQGSLNRMDT